MAHVLKFIYGSNTITLTSGDYRGVDRFNIGTITRRGVQTDSIELFIFASNLAGLQAAVRNINKAFQAAQRRRQTGTSDRVYVHFQESGDSDTYRSEIWSDNLDEVPGRVVVPSMWLTLRFWDNEKIKILITYSRRPFWEDASETELSLSNGSGSGTGGQTVRNPHTAAVLTDTSISFDETGGVFSILDDDDGLAIFAEGDVISVRGSTSNDGIYTVITAAAGVITVNETITDEVKGDTVIFYDMNNYVHIDSSVILGDLPTPVRLEMTNSDAGAELQTVWIGNNYLSEPDDFAHLLEFEDSDTGANTGNAGASSGFYRQYTVPDAAEAKITGWTLESITLSKTNNNYFKVLFRSFNGTNITDVKWRIKILYATVVIYSGPQQNFVDTFAGISRLWREIDTIQLPPFPMEGGTPADLTLELWGVPTSGGAEVVDLDVMMLLPTNGYRKLKSTGGLAQNWILVDDGILGIYYRYTSAGQTRDIIAEGEHIMLWPGIDNRVYFVQHSETANTADRDRSMSVKAYYRPRRAVI